MMEKSTRQYLADAYEHLADALDVPATKYKEAQDRYRAVGEWLNKDAAIAAYQPDIYPQGSFALGTVVKPLNREEYDVDAVCILKLANRDAITQQRVKELVGLRLKEHEKYRQMLNPIEGGRRCWTLQYADSSYFHMDILPSIPDPNRMLYASLIPHKLLESAIYVTDKTTWNSPMRWPNSNKSNPRGYQEWFKERMKVVFERQRQLLAEAKSGQYGFSKSASVVDVPDYEVRTPLQRLVQVLKRHRDQRYQSDDDKPISIIITTLAARAYDNQENLLDALLSVVPQMRSFIEERDGVWWVQNPVNPDENFADKWAETPRKADIFFQWLTAVENEHKSLLESDGLTKTAQYLSEAFGSREASTALAKCPAIPAVRKPGVISWVLARFNVGHKKQGSWTFSLGRHNVTVTGQFQRNGWRARALANDGAPIPRNGNLIFTARTDIQKPYKVYWQIVNTGNEASQAGALRGEIIDSQIYRGDLVWDRESTRYRGMHWIECFIVRENVCLARSGEFVINIE